MASTNAKARYGFPFHSWTADDLKLEARTLDLTVQTITGKSLKDDFLCTVEWHYAKLRLEEGILLDTTKFVVKDASIACLRGVLADVQLYAPYNTRLPKLRELVNEHWPRVARQLSPAKPLSPTRTSSPSTSSVIADQVNGNFSEVNYGKESRLEQVSSREVSPASDPPPPSTASIQALVSAEVQHEVQRLKQDLRDKSTTIAAFQRCTEIAKSNETKLVAAVAEQRRVCLLLMQENKRLREHNQHERMHYEEMRAIVGHRVQMHACHECGCEVVSSLSTSSDASKPQSHDLIDLLSSPTDDNQASRSSVGPPITNAGAQAKDEVIELRSELIKRRHSYQDLEQRYSSSEATNRQLKAQLSEHIEYKEGMDKIVGLDFCKGCTTKIRAHIRPLRINRDYVANDNPEPASTPQAQGLLSNRSSRSSSLLQREAAGEESDSSATDASHDLHWVPPCTH